MDKLTSNLINLLKGFRQQMEEYLPAIEVEIDRIIDEKVENTREIEYLFDSLLPLCQHDIGNSLYKKLLEYYKTIDEEGAKFYWEEYNNLED